MSENEGDLPRNPIFAFKCKECGREFKSRQGLSMHVTRMHAKKERPNWGANVRRDDQAPVVTGEHRLKAEAAYQRPLDEGKLAKYESEQGLLDMIETSEYEDALKQFLPVLASELDRQGTDVNLDLVRAFLALYLDAS